VSPRHRLHAIVKLREQEEGRALQGVAAAQRETAAAQEASRAAAARARGDHRRGSALDWDIADHAQAAALRAARLAEQAAAAAARDLDRKLEEFVQVHSRTEALRRVVKTRTDELVAEAELRERKSLDEIAILRHVQSRSSR
jgi:hypothetical protein